jgi:hypothetical protein
VGSGEAIGVDVKSNFRFTTHTGTLSDTTMQASDLFGKILEITSIDSITIEASRMLINTPFG